MKHHQLYHYHLCILILKSHSNMVGNMSLKKSLIHQSIKYLVLCSILYHFHNLHFSLLFHQRWRNRGQLQLSYLEYKVMRTIENGGRLYRIINHLQYQITFTHLVLCAFIIYNVPIFRILAQQPSFQYYHHNYITQYFKDYGHFRKVDQQMS